MNRRTADRVAQFGERDKLKGRAGRTGPGWAMVFEFPQVQLGDDVEACRGKMLDAQKNRRVLHPYLENSKVRWSSFDLQDLAVMRFDEHEEARYGIQDGDLVVCEGGEPGRCAIWRDEMSAMKIQKAEVEVPTRQPSRCGGVGAQAGGVSGQHLVQLIQPNKAIYEPTPTLPPLRRWR